MQLGDLGRMLSPSTSYSVKGGSVSPCELGERVSWWTWPRAGARPVHPVANARVPLLVSVLLLMASLLLLVSTLTWFWG